MSYFKMSTGDHILDKKLKQKNLIQKFIDNLAGMSYE